MYESHITRCPDPWRVPERLPRLRPRRLSHPLSQTDETDSIALELTYDQCALLNRLLRRVKKPQIPYSDEAAKVQQCTSNQEGSPIFRLPLEIRQMIWLTCLDYNRIHVLRRPGKLGYRVCLDYYGMPQSSHAPFPFESYTDHDHATCRELMEAPGPGTLHNVRRARPRAVSHDELLPLIKTCRRM